MKLLRWMFLAITSLADIVQARFPTRQAACKTDIVHQFPNGSWIENIAVRRNGQLLVTDATRGQVYLLDPDSSTSGPSVVARFPTGNYVTGITEVETDVFYVATGVGNFYNFTFQSNTNSIWQIDLRSSTASKPTTVRKLVDVPRASFLNGLTTLSSKDGSILAADSVAGTIWYINVRTLDRKIVADFPLLQRDPKVVPSLGVNGIRIAHRSNATVLYFSNTNKALLGMVPVQTKNNGGSSGITINSSAVKVFASSLTYADDFAVDARDDTVWLTQNGANMLVHISVSGKVTPVAGGPNSGSLRGPTSAAFGSGSDNQALYITNSGVRLDSATGQIAIMGGNIVRLNVRTC